MFFELVNLNFLKMAKFCFVEKLENLLHDSV